VTLIIVLLLIGVITGLFVSFLRKRGGIVSVRGMSSGADAALLSDQRRVRIVAVSDAGPDRLRVVLAAANGGSSELTAPDAPDLDVIVALGPSDFGFGLVDGWARAGTVLALVMPERSRIIRLRSLDDQQPVTLRRVDL
jgi:hypothetical protein